MRGHIDSLTSSGYVEGWAFNEDRPERPLKVSIADDAGQEVALGYAHRYRADLAEVNFAFGWCAFRLRLSRSVTALRRSRLILAAAETGAEIHAGEDWRVRDDVEAPLSKIEEVMSPDPTILKSLSQLRGSEPLITRYIARRGVTEFLRTAYVYILSRPADAAGIAAYGKLIRSGEMTPFGLLTILLESEEFRARPRFLSPPNTPGFVFSE